jgi:hypothetical protein
MPGKLPATPAQFLALLPDDRRSALTALHRAILKTAPGIKARVWPIMANGMLGYGSYRYVYANGKEADWPVVALASNKACISLYVAATDAKGHLAAQNAARLGQVSVGAGCIRFKRLEQLHLPVALELIQAAFGQRDGTTQSHDT